MVFEKLWFTMLVKSYHAHGFHQAVLCKRCVCCLPVLAACFCSLCPLIVIIGDRLLFGGGMR